VSSIVKRLLAIGKASLALVVATGIAGILVLACWWLIDATAIVRYNQPILYLVVWAGTTALLAGAVVGCLWTRQRGWLTGASFAVVYFGLIIPNWVHIFNRARATIPGEQAWRPAPVPWHTVGAMCVVGIGTAIYAACVSAQLRRKALGASSEGSTA
jgi:hypothetical protein